MSISSLTSASSQAYSQYLTGNTSTSGSQAYSQYIAGGTADNAEDAYLEYITGNGSAKTIADTSWTNITDLTDTSSSDGISASDPTYIVKAVGGSSLTSSETKAAESELKQLNTNRLLDIMA